MKLGDKVIIKVMLGNKEITRIVLKDKVVYEKQE